MLDGFEIRGLNSTLPKSLNDFGDSKPEALVRVTQPRTRQSTCHSATCVIRHAGQETGPARAFRRIFTGHSRYPTSGGVARHNDLHWRIHAFRRHGLHDGVQRAL